MNQLITSDVFFHWLSFVIFLIFELILSRISLLTFPSSLFAGFMRRHVGWLVKLSLWSSEFPQKICRPHKFSLLESSKELFNKAKPQFESALKHSNNKN